MHKSSKQHRVLNSQLTSTHNNHYNEFTARLQDNLEHPVTRNEQTS